MAVYIAASDESDGPLQNGPFVYGGFVGPSRDWIDWFAPAWEERVLNPEPVLAYFHMAEIRSPKWQARNGWTATDAERRIEEAVRVVASSGSIHLVRTSFDGGHFRQLFGSARVIKRDSQPGTYPFDPDYVGFLGFARGVLEYVHSYHDDVERVDFIVERKTRVSHYLPNYLDSLEKWLRENGTPRLVDLIGELIPGDKTRVPLQAADLAMWHVRRHEAGESERIDVRRIRQMFNGRTLTLSGLTNDEISTIAARYTEVPPANQRRLKTNAGGDVS
jgi:hypothetical protein